MNKNEPAFPRLVKLTNIDQSTQISECIDGLTKREYFAAMVMQGYLSKFADVNGRPEHAQDCARAVVKLADALLAELEKINDWHGYTHFYPIPEPPKGTDNEQA